MKDTTPQTLPETIPKRSTRPALRFDVNDFMPLLEDEDIPFEQKQQLILLNKNNN